MTPNGQQTMIDETRTMIIGSSNNICDNETVISVNFIIEALQEACLKLQMNKATRPCLIPSQILKLLTTRRSKYVSTIYNKLAKTVLSHQVWKSVNCSCSPKAKPNLNTWGRRGPFVCWMLKRSCMSSFLREGWTGDTKNWKTVRKLIWFQESVTNHRCCQYGFVNSRKATSWNHRRICAVITLDVKKLLTVHHGNSSFRGKGWSKRALYRIILS